ncbi:hypothetical protein R3P38DRAFT_1647183 [Favolaschia claudopus]|uniref:Uncharacterized protein n=1 Tax=Favolaschia claudopus TaxID=2862362 RepID=A0AAW0DJR0_9AGAR
MSTNPLISRLLDRCFPASVQDKYTIPLLGLMGAGKTSLLRLLSSNGIVEQRTSAMALYLEVAEVHFPNISPRTIKIPSWPLGCSGKRLPLTLVAQATETRVMSSDALIWVVDSTARELFPDSAREFGSALRILSLSKSGQFPILILATKQDRPDAANTREIANMFPKGSSMFVLGITALEDGLNNGLLYEALNWLIASSDEMRAGKPPPLTPADDPRSLRSLEDELTRWIERASNDASTIRFLRMFESPELSQWDGYTRIRAIYSMLIKYARSNGREQIFHWFRKHAESSEEWPFSFTMTYFWIQVVHFGICSLSQSPALQTEDGVEYAAYLETMLDSESLFDSHSVISQCPSDWSVVDDFEEHGDGAGMNLKFPEIDIADQKFFESEEQLENGDDGFVRFLYLNPHIVDDKLWTEYYSTELMTSSKARTRMILPDKKRLPNLVGRDIILSAFKWKTG